MELATEQKKTSVPILPWMRNPIDNRLYEECPLNFLPFLDPRLETALYNMGITSLFPVQVAVWQETIGPGVSNMLSIHAIKCLRALVVLPTRDLAVQVKEVFASLAPAVGLSVGLAVELIKKPPLEAGSCFDSEDFSLGLRSSVDILVATPGRLMDHINNTKGFTLDHLCYLVVDETDRLLREAYQSWLPTVLRLAHNQSLYPIASNTFSTTFGSLKTIRRLHEVHFTTCYDPFTCGIKSTTLVKMVLSATLTQDPSKLAQLDLHHPLFLTTGPRRYQLPEQLKSLEVICESKLKPVYLLALLESLQGEKCIVFTSSVESTHKLCTLLNFFGDQQIKIKVYSRLQCQTIRSKTLRAFRSGEIQVLVSSDAMTRGMDVLGVKNVINYDMPAYIKTYIHRAGRTARAGQAGRCFTLLLKDEVKRFKKLLQKADSNSCPVYSIPSESIVSLRSMYASALQKLKESIESEKHRKYKVRTKLSNVMKTKESSA
ncbi:DEAD-box ATP-dependent RNA helicase 1 [Olea europaea subsp. europaea]|uniref:DEAD-box ATP-dependent RNA helicase 1 n=1 Tax=Olea europaea subsp. europaea TaxID=158383 RepID=A0A8S0RWG0_OLEEU|nr:DEAD-box ATP-dependent RNA helicase 1 [Olea europaea subsp. europaea]